MSNEASTRSANYRVALPDEVTADTAYRSSF